MSTLPSILGEKVVLRVLTRSQGIIELARLPFQPENMAAVRTMLRQPQGLILVVGPTGSGKTTTLYSFLQQLNKPDVNIITVEDPVEMRIPGLVQVAVNPRGGITFAARCGRCCARTRISSWSAKCATPRRPRSPCGRR